MDVVFPIFVRSSTDTVSTVPQKKEKSLLELVVEAKGMLGLVPQREAPKRMEYGEVKTEEKPLSFFVEEYSTWKPSVFCAKYLNDRSFKQEVLELYGVTGRGPVEAPLLPTVEDLRLPAKIENNVNSRLSFQDKRKRNIPTGAPDLEELRSLVFPEERAPGVLLTSLQQASFAHLLLGFHITLCGPKQSGKRFAAVLTAGIRVLENTVELEKSEHQYESLLVFHHFGDMIHSVREIQSIFDSDTFSFYMLDKGDFVPFDDQHGTENFPSRRKRPREEPKSPRKILLCTYHALSELMQSVDTVAALPLEFVHCCVFTNVEKVLLPPLAEQFNSLLWQSLVGVVDVNCQFVFTTSSKYWEVCQLVEREIFEPSHPRLAHWIQEDRSVYSFYDVKIVSFPVETVNGVGPDNEVITIEKSVQVAAMILNKSALLRSQSESTTKLKVVIIVTSRREQESVMNNIRNALQESTLRLTASSLELSRGDAEVLVITDNQLQDFREMRAFVDTPTEFSSVIHYSLPRRNLKQNFSEEEDVSHLRHAIAARLRSLLPRRKSGFDEGCDHRVESPFLLTEYQRKGRLGKKLEEVLHIATL